MSSDEAREWAARWNEINRAEIAELRSSSFETKLRQLDSLMRSTELFEHTRREDDETVERDLWVRLRRALGSS